MAIQIPLLLTLIIYMIIDEFMPKHGQGLSESELLKQRNRVFFLATLLVGLIWLVWLAFYLGWV